MTIFEIRVKGHIDPSWSSWFDGLTISYDGNDNTLLSGPLADDAALHGVLVKVHNLALPLLAVSRRSAEETEKKGI